MRETLRSSISRNVRKGAATATLKIVASLRETLRSSISRNVQGNGSLEVVNILGQKIKTVYQGRINAGNQVFEISIPSAQRAALIYIFRMGDKQITGKLLPANR